MSLFDVGELSSFLGMLGELLNEFLVWYILGVVSFCALEKGVAELFLLVA